MLEKLAAFADKFDMFPREGLILTAVSGGADSVCLLVALCELSKTQGFSVAACHFNHQLRGAESERDALFVTRLCTALQVALYTGHGDVRAFAKAEGLGIEAAARSMRYDFFAETAKKINAQRIATAHTADDNAETVLFNLTRGAGLNGLSGIPPKRGHIIRPMLQITREEVEAFLVQRDMTFVEDTTNSLDIYSRNKIRHHVVPVLKELNPRLLTHIASAAERIRADETYLNSVAQSYIDTHVRYDKDHTTGSFSASSLAALPEPISSRVIRLIYGTQLSLLHISSIMALCRSGSTSGSLSLPSGCAYREYDRIVFADKCDWEGFSPVIVPIGGSVALPELGLRVTAHKARAPDNDCREKINNSFTTFLFKYDNICGNIVIRPRETGDKIELFGRNGTKPLKKLFIERRIPRRMRTRVPVVADSQGVLAVYGIGHDRRATCQPGDESLEIIFEESAYEK